MPVFINYTGYCMILGVFDNIVSMHSLYREVNEKLDHEC